MKIRSLSGIAGALLAATAACANDSLDAFATDLPSVLTPTRLRQSLGEVPASVTVITAAMIRDFHVASIVDALRLVPGMAITQTSGNNFRVNYHGTNILTPQRMNVLIDGRTAYRARLSSPDWMHLPVDIEDVERIEVTRGPNSASYGANSMMAIINIITRHPDDVDPSVSARLGSAGHAEGHAHFGGSIGESTRYRVTASGMRDTGYDHSVNNRFGDIHDGVQNSMIEFRSHSDLDNRSRLEVQAAYVQGVTEIDFMDAYQRQYPDVHSKQFDGSIAYDHEFSDAHSIRAQFYGTTRRDSQPWVTCPPPIAFLPTMYQLWEQNPNYAKAILAGKKPSGGTPADDALAAAVLKQYASLGPARKTPICVDTDQDSAESRFEGEIQDTLVFSEHLRLVTGATVRHERFESTSYFGGKVDSSSASIFANGEYRPNKIFTVNLGGYYEHTGMTGDAFSPRVALNAHLSGNHAVRLIYSEAVRTPTAFEQRSNWNYYGYNAKPTLFGESTLLFYAHNRATPDQLDYERIRSVELGYVGTLPDYGLQYDMKVFSDRMSDLISEKLNVYRTSPITNSNRATLKGAELQLDWRPSEATRLWGTYTYLENDASIITEQTQYARHSGGIGISRELNQSWQASVYWWSYGAPMQPADGQTYISMEDLALTYRCQIGGSRISTTVSARHNDNPKVSYWQDYGSIKSSWNESHWQAYAGVQVQF